MLGRLKSAIGAEGMTGPALIMLAATIAGGFCNFLFHIVAQQNAFDQYGEIAALLALLYIVSVPSTAVQNVMVRHASVFSSQGRDDNVSWLMRRALRATLALGAGLCLALIVLLNLPPVHSALRLSGWEPTVMVGACALLSIVTPVASGPMQAFQWYGRFGSQNVANYLAKLLAGGGMMVLGYGAAGALGGITVGYGIATGLCFYMTRRWLRSPGAPSSARDVWRTALPSLVGVLCFTILIKADVIFGQAMFPTLEYANNYSGASNLAEITIFLPQAVATVMYPRIAMAHAARSGVHRILRSAVLLTVALSGMVALAYLLAPELILNILVPGRYDLEVAVPVLQLMSVAMALMGLANLFILYGLATGAHAHITIQVVSVFVMIGLLAAAYAMVDEFTPMVLSLCMVGAGAFSITMSSVRLLTVERAAG